MDSLQNRVKERQQEQLYAAGSEWLKLDGLAHKTQVDLRSSENAARLQLGKSRNVRMLAAIDTSGTRGIVGPGSIEPTVAFAERIIGRTIDWTSRPKDEAARLAGAPVFRIIERSASGRIMAIATGFLVSPRLALTNHHVFAAPSDAAMALAQFGYEDTDTGAAEGFFVKFRPDECFFADKRLDFALTAIEIEEDQKQLLSSLGFLPPSKAVGKALLGDAINIIQHPSGRTKRYATEENHLLAIDESGSLAYTTDTEPGSSGSPLLSANWELLGLHSSGVPKMEGGNILTRTGQVYDPERDSDDDIEWVANKGYRISKILECLGTANLADDKQQRVLEDFLVFTEDPLEVVEETKPIKLEFSSDNPAPVKPVFIQHRVIEQSRGSEMKYDNSENKSSQSLAISGGKGDQNAPMMFNFYAPVNIYINGAGQDIGLSTSTSLESPQPLGEEKVLQFDPDYELREGYKTDFLGESAELEVPLPTVSDETVQQLYSKDGSPLELKYHHFSLVFNRVRRFAQWTAGNVDYRKSKRDDRPRAAFGTDKWIPDPRIPLELQVNDKIFYGPAKKIDRGHLVRREDNCFGDTPELIEFSNSDTYHWTNCTPQHEAFNQGSGGNSGKKAGVRGIWGQFEGYVQDELLEGLRKACIFSGPVYQEDDPSEDYGHGRIQYPLSFWKVVVTVSGQGNNRRLALYGFVFSQKDVVDRFGIEAFDAAQFRRFRKPLAQIQELTGVIFDEKLHAADQHSGHLDL